jgi:hypothetical protein
MSAKTSNLRYARALCLSAGVDGVWLADAVQEVLLALQSNPGRFRHAAAARALKRSLARQNRRSLRSLPSRLDRLKQVGRFSRERMRYAQDSLRDARALACFDLHSKYFAVENGVCPCCTRPGSFPPERGRCSCGFAYD